MIATLPRVLPSPDGKPVPPPGTADVFRAFAQDLAAGRRPWTAETAQFIAAQLDQLAAGWDTTRATGRDDPCTTPSLAADHCLRAPASNSAPAPACSPSC
ncbi:hypothetical protein ACFYRY_40430 [Streptomyces sp. NPDC005263]|uniref:hypothetical protein n=1 Tax=Streptomyces sp. NPDC005263 TaxID=3364711 RepID=UPI0036B7FE4B